MVVENGACFEDAHEKREWMRSGTPVVLGPLKMCGNKGQLVRGCVFDKLFKKREFYGDNTGITDNNMRIYCAITPQNYESGSALVFWVFG